VDRDAIERRDFPVGRRGYDQDAVHAHLRRVADEFQALRADASVAVGTSDQVRVILEAAEAGAAELRADAGRRAGEHVARVEAAAGAMLGRLDELERELDALLAALRDSGARLTEELARLRHGVAQVDGEVAAADETAAGTTALGESVGDTAAEEAAGDDASEVVAPPDGDEAGARLTALNLALSGTPREETARYLAEHFRVANAAALLDDVYSRAGR
jgi:DivIVA domain-containing protein